MLLKHGVSGIDLTEQKWRNIRVIFYTPIFHYRSYLADTVSWLEPSLSRKSAVLLCRRMTGRVTYDKIADTLQKSFDDYGLRGKVTKVITDNGANFVKAFRYVNRTLILWAQVRLKHFCLPFRADFLAKRMSKTRITTKMTKPSPRPWRWRLC